MTPSITRGYILWFPLTEAINADSRDQWPDFRLIEANLVAGVDLLERLVALRNTDVTPHFKIAAVPSSPPVDVEPQPAEGAERTANAPAPSATVDFEEIRAIANAMSADDKQRIRAIYGKRPAEGDPVAFINAVLHVQGFHDVIAVEPKPRQSSTPAPDAKPTLPAATDDDDLIDDATLTAAGKVYAGLADVPRGWVSVCGAKVRLKPPHGVPSVRRFELLRGLCILAEAGFDNDDAARAVLAAILDDIVWQVPVADAVAALDVDDAKRFARICDAVAASLTPFEFPDDGRTIVDPKVLEVAA